MYVKIESRDQLLTGCLLRNIDKHEEVLEISDYDAESDYYELSVFGRVAPQTGGKGDDMRFGSTFEKLLANYEVEVVDGGFRNEGEL